MVELRDLFSIPYIPFILLILSRYLSTAEGNKNLDRMDRIDRMLRGKKSVFHSTSYSSC